MKNGEIRASLTHSGLIDLAHWAQDVVKPDTEFTLRVIFAGFFIITEAVVGGFGSVSFAAVWVFWICDMAGGIARAKSQGHRFQAGRALGGILKFGVIMAAWVATVTAEQMFIELASGVGFSSTENEAVRLNWIVLAAGAGVFLGSFADQVGYYIPPIGNFLSKVASKFVKMAPHEKQAGK